MKYIKLLVIVSLLLHDTIFAQVGAPGKPVHPKLYGVQFAGNLGVAAVGVGTRFFHDRIYMGLAYGYLPESVNGVEVHTIALKPGYEIKTRHFSDKTKVSFYTGVGILYAITRNTYVVYPDYYPSGYYKPNALHAAPFTGIRFSYRYQQTPGKTRWIGLFCELGTVDDYLYNLAIGKSEYKSNMWNLALGLSVEVL